VFVGRRSSTVQVVGRRASSTVEAGRAAGERRLASRLFPAFLVVITPANVGAESTNC